MSKKEETKEGKGAEMKKTFKKGDKVVLTRGSGLYSGAVGVVVYEGKTTGRTTVDLGEEYCDVDPKILDMA